MIKVQLDNGAYMPEKAHACDAGYDLRSMERVFIPCYTDGVVIDTGVHMEIPEGYFGKTASRSGLAFKHGVVTVEGIIDSGYTGSIRVKLRNDSGTVHIVEAGDKISQLIIMPCVNEQLEKVDTLEETERGSNGFGSSGR